MQLHIASQLNGADLKNTTLYNYLAAGRPSSIDSGLHGSGIQCLAVAYGTEILYQVIHKDTSLIFCYYSNNHKNLQPIKAKMKIRLDKLEFRLSAIISKARDIVFSPK
jgi:hypothetical protein